MTDHLREGLAAQLEELASQRGYASAPSDTWIVNGWRVGIAPSGPARLLAFRNGEVLEFDDATALVAALDSGPAAGFGPPAFCTNCGNRIGPSDPFCASCGAPVGTLPMFGGPPPPPADAKVSGLAVASVVLSVLWLAGLGSLTAIVLGAVALRAISRSQGRRSGNTAAIVGIALGAVGLIVTMLMALALPTFLGARERAQDRVAQTSLRNALTAAKAIFTDNESYTDATPQALQAAEPTLVFIDAEVPSTSWTTVSSGSPHPKVFFAAVLSASGTCWYARDSVGQVGEVESPGTWWARVDSPSSCSAVNAPAVGWALEPT